MWIGLLVVFATYLLHCGACFIEQMGGRWNPVRSQFLCFLVFIIGLPIHGSWALNDEVRLSLPSEFQFDASASSHVVDQRNRKFGHRFKMGMDGLPAHGDFTDTCSSKLVNSLDEQHAFKNVEILVTFARRRLLDSSSNLAAAPAENGSSSVSSPVIFLSSGSFPAIPTDIANRSSPTVSPTSSSNSTDSPSQSVQPINQQRSSGRRISWVYYLIIAVAVVLIIVLTAVIFMHRKKGVPTIGPWKTGLSGQLQKAFVTGVPKLNRQELETACEDFSNIVEAFDHSMVYKGTLSSGVEIAVVSTTVGSSKEWSKAVELNYRKQIDTLSRINHKNFVNLLGYCEEEEAFTRMMVFEYAPNGTLFEHLHVKEMENLDWIARMRIIMGTAYCLQYIHHELNPPVAHCNLTSNCIYLTDDYAAKIAEISFPADPSSKAQDPGEERTEPTADAETNVYSFGILLLEMISGKLPYSEEQGPIEKWAEQYFRDKRSISYMIDPNIKTLKDNELDVIVEVIQKCIRSDPSQRPTMKEITSRLKEVIGITPEQAIPRLSPLWWAELEILSVEGT